MEDRPGVSEENFGRRVVRRTVVQQTPVEAL
jgi:hypothetical protein